MLIEKRGSSIPSPKHNEVSKPKRNAFLETFRQVELSIWKKPRVRLNLGTRPSYQNNPLSATYRQRGEHLIDFDDADLPYEISRGQVIPYYQDARGRRFYFTGVDKRFQEAAGFGGYIEGRIGPSGHRAGMRATGALGPGEDVAMAALREFTEESMYTFLGTFTPAQYFASPYFIIRDTIVVLLRVNIEPEEAINRFKRTESQKERYNANAYRENAAILVSSADTMQSIATGSTKTMENYPIWDVYADLLRDLRAWYEYEF